MLRRVAENIATGGVQSRLFGFVARELFGTADAAMYRAKMAGRNQVKLA
jgi:PleD family two-component response regulator